MTLYVLRSCQGRGVGRRLLADVARVLAANGAESLMLSVLRDNIPARAFYEHLGGKAEAPRREPGPGGVTVSEAKALDDAAAMLESRDSLPVAGRQSDSGEAAK